MTEYQEDIWCALRRMYDYDFTYLWTMHVNTEYRGRAWSGDVEVYAVHGDPNAIHAYAWGVDEVDAVHYIAYLGLPPVRSPLQAVLTAIREGIV